MLRGRGSEVPVRTDTIYGGVFLEVTKVPHITDFLISFD